MNDKLPTAEEMLNEFYPTEYINPSLKVVLVAAIESHTAAHTEGLREEISKLEKEAQDRIEFIPIYEGKIRQERCRADDAEKRVKELEAENTRLRDSLEKAINVVHSLSEPIQELIDILEDAYYE